MFSDSGWKDGGGVGKKFPIDGQGVGLVGIIPHIYTQIPKNFFKTRRGEWVCQTPPGTFSLWYTPSYITGTSIWVAEIQKEPYHF